MMREEIEPSESSDDTIQEETRACEPLLPVALRNDEISKEDFEELCRLAEVAKDAKSPAKSHYRRIPSGDPADASK